MHNTNINLPPKPLPIDAIASEVTNYAQHLDTFKVTEEDALIAEEHIKNIGDSLAEAKVAYTAPHMPIEKHDRLTTTINAGLKVLSEMTNKYSGD